MRELQREEYSMISGGIDTSNLHTVFVDAPPSPSSSTGSLQINLSTGLSKSQGGSGGSATVKFGANGNITSATVNCPTGTSPSIASGSGNITGSGKAVMKVLGVNVGVSGGGGTVTCVR